MDWNREKILERAAGMRQAADVEREKADLRIQTAILLEEIARAWPEPRTAHWIRWGQYLKCSACGHMVEEKADECPECGGEDGGEGMSVLIKGMDMPKDCEHCRFCGIDVESGCWIKKNWIIRKVGAARPDWCPFVEVPTPHGALIDRDKLTGEQYKEGNLMVVEMDAIEDAPIIIEAEE